MPSLFALMDPLWFIEVPVCMCGSVFGGPIALLVLLRVRQPIARRVANRLGAWFAGAAVGAGLGVLTFNITFVIMLAWSSDGRRATRSDDELNRVVRDRLIFFTIGGAILGVIPGMIAVGSAYRDRSAPPPAS